MSRIVIGLLVAATVLLVGLSAFSGSIAHLSPSSSASTAPAGPPSPALAPASGVVTMSTPSHSVAGASSEPKTETPASPPCSPHWSSIYFERDVCVTFSVPGAGGVPPPINYVPFNSTVSRYATGFWMNISTDVPIAVAVLNIWATS